MTLDQEFSLKAKILHDWNVVLDSKKNRFEKLKAMSAIETEWSSGKHLNSKEDLDWFVLGGFQVLTSEPVEKLRLSALRLLQTSYSVVNEWSSLLSIVLQVLRPRMSHQDSAGMEEAEEIRRDTVKLLSDIVGEKIDSNEFPIDQVDPLLSLLALTANDPFHDVRRETFKLISILADKFPALIKPHVSACLSFTVSSLAHRHAQVRGSCVKAVGRLLHVDVDGLRDTIENHLKKLLFDSSPSVRMALYEVFRDFCLEHRDRYAIHWMTITIVLGGCCDESLKHSEYCQITLDKFADLVETELRDQIRDLRDFQAEKATRGGIYRLGLIYLIRDGLYKMVHHQLLPDLTHWQPEIRVKTLEILSKLLPLSGTHCTGFSLALCQSIWKIVLGDDDLGCKKLARSLFPLLAAELEFSFLAKILLDLFEAPGLLSNGPEVIEAFVAILISVFTVYNKQQPKLSGEDDFSILVKVTETLYANLLEFANRLDSDLFISYCDCLIQSGEILDKGDSLKLLIFRFCLLLDHLHSPLTMACFNNDQKGNESIVNLYLKEFPKCFDEAPHKQSHSWVSLTNLHKFALAHDKPIDKSLTWAILQQAKCHNGCLEDPTLNYKYLEFVGLFAKSGTEYLASIIESIVVPNLAWKPGPRWQIIRTVCVKIIRDTEFPNLYSFNTESLKSLIACLDEDSIDLKMATLQVLKVILESQVFPKDDDVNRRSLIKEIVARMDDSDQKIRKMTCEVIKVLFANESFTSLDNSSWDYLFDCLFVHLDDADLEIQEIVSEALQQGRLFQSEAYATNYSKNCGKIKRAIHLLSKLKV